MYFNINSMDFIIDSSSGTNSNIISGLSDNIVYNSILLSSSNNLQSNIIITSNYASNISNVLLINYNSLNTTTSNYASNISNVLTIRDATNLINTSNYASNISNVLINNINTKQPTLTAATTLLGVGSSISALDYSKITLNKPSTFPADMTNIYNKTEINNISNLNSNYTTSKSFRS